MGYIRLLKVPRCLAVSFLQRRSVSDLFLVSNVLALGAATKFRDA